MRILSNTRFGLFHGFLCWQMFCRTQWPSPEEYSQLEVQTSLGRTDIVRWFKDHRSALKSGEALDWMNASQNPTLKQKRNQEQNGQASEDVPSEAKSVAAADQPGEKAAAATAQARTDRDKVQWLTDRIAHGVTDLIRTRPDQTSPSTEKGRWVKKKRKIQSICSGCL